MCIPTQTTEDEVFHLNLWKAKSAYVIAYNYTEFVQHYIDSQNQTAMI